MIHYLLYFWKMLTALNHKWGGVNPHFEGFHFFYENHILKCLGYNNFGLNNDNSSRFEPQKYFNFLFCFVMLHYLMFWKNARCDWFRADGSLNYVIVFSVKHVKTMLMFNTLKIIYSQLGSRRCDAVPTLSQHRTNVCVRWVRGLNVIQSAPWIRKGVSATL